MPVTALSTLIRIRSIQLTGSECRFMLVGASWLFFDALKITLKMISLCVCVYLPLSLFSSR